MNELQCRVYALAFARDWYNRPQTGCDEATLAALLEDVLRRVYRETYADTKKQVVKIFEQIIHKATSVD
jgi:hypothetical protein